MNKEEVLLLKNIAELFYHSTSVNTMKTKDPYDDMLLKCAIEGKADYLITNDFRAGFHDREYSNLLILSASDFVKLYEEEYGEIIIID